MTLSNYGLEEDAEEVRVSATERPCTPCRGMGSVEVHGQETDCIECEGYGSVLV